VHPDNEWRHQVKTLARELESSFIDATVALNLFEQDEADCIQAITERQPEKERAWRRERSQQLRESFGRERYYGLSSEERNAVDRQIELRAKREAWEAGWWPRAFTTSVASLYAQAFLYALDAFRRALWRLEQVSGIAAIASESAAFKASFPYLKDVRDSEAHRDERLLGLKQGKPIAPQSVQVPFLHLPAGVITMGYLNGRRYGNMMSDGNYGEVEISVASLELLRERLQAVVDALPWAGDEQHLPY
jgi:hypothetical protein